MNIRFLIMMMVCLTVLAAPVRAQENALSFSETLEMLNQTQIRYSPRYKTDRDILSLRVLDHNRRVVGDVVDIQFDEGGMPAMLVSEINRVGRRDSAVQSDFSRVVYHENFAAFEIPLTREERQEGVSAEDLAAIAPAAGGGHLFSLKAMVGAKVLSEQGSGLGEVKNVIFDRESKKLAALLLEDVPGADRYREIALPFDPQQVKMVSNFGRVEFRVEQKAAKLLTDFAWASR